MKIAGMTVWSGLGDGLGIGCAVLMKLLVPGMYGRYSSSSSVLDFRLGCLLSIEGHELIVPW